jgi:hypothetical protein
LGKESLYITHTVTGSTISNTHAEETMDIFIRCSFAAKEVVRQANHYTNCHGENVIRGEDLLLGLAVDPNGPLQLLMKKLNHSSDRLKGVKDKSIQPLQPEVPCEKKPLSLESKFALFYAAAEAWWRLSHEIEPIDILKALLFDHSKVPYSRLNALGIDEELIKKEFPPPPRSDPSQLSPEERVRLENLIALAGQEPGNILGMVSVCERTLNSARGLTQSIPPARKQ